MHIVEGKEADAVDTQRRHLGSHLRSRRQAQRIELLQPLPAVLVHLRGPAQIRVDQVVYLSSTLLNVLVLSF